MNAVSADFSDVPCRLVIRSVGKAQAAVVGALRQVLPFSEEHLAACLYRAPSELISPLDRPTAEALAKELTKVGLDAEVLAIGEPFAPGRPDFDVALVIPGFERLVEVAREIAGFLGLSLDQARQMLYASPMELIGGVSGASVEAIRHRFEPLGVAVVGSRRNSAIYDLFLAPCSPRQRAQMQRHLLSLGMQAESSEAGDLVPGRIGTGLSAGKAETIWQRTRHTDIPLRLVNRDFQRFDVRLDGAPETPDMIRYLTETTGMPETVARKIPARTPIYTHANRSYDEMNRCLEQISRLGGCASAHLVTLQRFSLELARIGDLDLTARLIELFGGMNTSEGRSQLRSPGRLDWSLTAQQARWLQHELRQVGTEARLVMR